MTGRKLYDALTDAWALRYGYERASSNNGALKEKSPAWAFLTSQEKRTFSTAASSLTSKKRR